MPVTNAPTADFDLPIQLGLGMQGIIRLPNPMTSAQWTKFESAIDTVKQLKTFLVSDDARYTDKSEK